ncbi:MAG: amidohydrolase family protein [Microbacterium sp.]|uniref:amidohydrolase family protein n=1 Tax=Microbacterium sp. TaxID=51671 RepID=UPI003D6F1C2A
MEQSTENLNESDTPWAAERVIDCHLHERANPDALIAHLDGSGVSSALVLAFTQFDEHFARLREEHPGRVVAWARGAQLVDGSPAEDDPAGRLFSFGGPAGIIAPEVVRSELAALRDDGWRGFAETAGPVEADGPELQRVYALAAELDVPVMMHFQETAAPGQPAYGIRGFRRIESMLKKFPSTRFVCHAPDFWGSIDVRYTDGGTYLTDAVSPGGLSDRLMSDYENMFGDLGAPSALLQLTRDEEFTAGFLDRHSEKLMFGSDCGCADGQGMPTEGASWPMPAAGRDGETDVVELDAAAAAAMQSAMASLGGLARRCIARELLAVTWRATTTEVFRRIASDNAVRVYDLPRG